MIEIREKKSAKDIAFDKERAKYRKQILELERENRSLANTVMNFNGMVQERDAKIIELQDWIERLLEYTELSENEMRKIIQKDKASSEFFEEMANMKKVMSRLGFFGAKI